jgi:two-component system sensor histidine kinase/response regulator
MRRGIEGCADAVAGMTQGSSPGCRPYGTRASTLPEGGFLNRAPLVLGVDDSPRNIAILRRSLGREFDFVSASSGEEALEIVAQQRPDLVLLDIMMDGIDGYETCRRMRAMPRLASTKIIMVSAKAQTSERLEGYDAGADDYVTKPFDPDELLAKVRVYVRLKTLEEVDGLKSELLNLLGHETRTPLTAILGPLPFLLEAGNLTGEQLSLLHMMESGARRLYSLLDKIAFLCQLRAQAVPLELGTRDLAEAARAAAGRAAQPADAAGVEVRVACEGPLTANADATHIGWVLDALLANAIQVSPRGGIVTMSLDGDDRFVCAEIADQGPGVPPDLRAKLFEPFVVGDVHHHKEGHGLSLAIAHRIVDLHGGTLDLVERDGPGACFRVQLPAAAATELAA